MGGIELPPTVSKLSPRRVALAFVEAFYTLGIEPTHKLVVTCVAHSALETGHWEAMFCFNFGNVKATDAWIEEGGSFTFFPARPDGRAGVSENLNEAQMRYWLARAKPRTDGGSGLDMVVGGKRRDGRYSCWFYPSNIQARFRAFPRLVEGSYHYLAKLNGRYAPALPYALRGNPAAYVNTIHALGYFTAGLAGYRSSVVRLYQQYSALDFPLDDPAERYGHRGPNACL